MDDGDKTAERMDKAARMVDKHTIAADVIDWCISQLNCLSHWHWLNYYPMILT